MLRKLSIFLVFLALLGLLSGCNDSPTGNTVKITNPIQTCKTVDVPYEELEPYIEQEPYQAIEEYQVDLKFEVIEAKSSTTLHGFDVWAVSTVKVKNVDSETGMFTIQQWFKKFEKESEKFSSNEYIMPGETKEFVQEYDVDAGEKWSSYHQVFPGQKTLTKTVTKYRDVTKYQMITKYRQEEVCE